MDHEGEVGKGSQHESWDEAGGDVVAWLADKVDDHLKGSFFNLSRKLDNLFGVSVSSCINDGVVVDKELHNGLCSLVVYFPRLDQDLVHVICT